MAKPNHIPKFGNWDPSDRVPYTEVFNNARAGKGGKLTNPNDPMENETSVGKSSDGGSVNHRDAASRPTARHQRKASRDDTDFGQAFNASKGDDEPNSQFDSGAGMGMGSGVSPIHPQQAYGGRLGRKPGSASPAYDKKPDAGAPGTPNRNRPERYAAPLPKFGDWDVNNPSAGDGFTFIFDKARDEKKTGGALKMQESPLRPEPAAVKPAHQESTKWFCRCFQPSTV